MIWWIELQQTPVIAVMTLALCYAIALGVFILTRLVARHPVTAEAKFIAPVLLTPLSLVTGLLIAFLAARVWTNLDRANGYVTEEASATREAALLAEALPADTGDRVREGLQLHLHFVEIQDWPEMLAGTASVRQPPPALRDTLAVLLAFDATTSGQRVAQERAVVAIERALEARRGRILLSQAVIAPIQWLVIFVLDGLILATIGLVHLDRRPAAIAGMLLFSTGIACVLTLLMIHDRPLTPGGFVVQPAVLRQLRGP